MKQPISKLFIFVCLLVFNTMQTTMSQTRAEDEHLVKAAFIYNFAKFTHWPENTQSKPYTPLNLCTIGKDKLVGELKRLSGKTIHERPITVLSLVNGKNLAACHLLYIATSEENNYKNILKSIDSKPVLSISELTHFGRSGGIIELYRDKGQIHFIINLAATRKAELILSSRLLRLAKIINHENAQ